MRYAIDKNNQRIEAQKGVRAFCPICSEEVIAKCGNVKIPHWAHKHGGDCDKWSENKTQWHIDWQNCFPKDMQEYILYDENTKEKHIADIYTPDKIIIEFQHSYIKEAERIEREEFYTKNGQKLVWVVDGNRLKTMYNNFEHIKNCSIKDDKYRNFVLCEDGCWIDTRYIDIFPENWSMSRVPVFFDFELKEENTDPLRKFLWCLFPELVKGKFVVMCITKKRFIEYINQGKPFINLLKIKYEELFKIYNDNINSLNNKLPNVKLSYFKIVQAKNKELFWNKYLQIGDIYIYGDKKIFKKLDIIVVDCVESYNGWRNKKKIKYDKFSKVVQKAKHIDGNIISSDGYELTLNLSSQSIVSYAKYMMTTTKGNSFAEQTDLPSFSQITLTISLSNNLLFNKMSTFEKYTVYTSLSNAETEANGSIIFSYQEKKMPSLTESISYQEIKNV